MMALFTAVRWNLIVVLICSSLIISGIEHLFYTHWAICLSSLEKCLFIHSYFAHFSIELFVFVVDLFCCMNCLYILEIKPMSVASFANTFSRTISFY